MTRSDYLGRVALTVDIVAEFALSVVAILATVTVLPLILGWHSHLVMSGSMAPRLRPGDVVISQPVPAQQVTLGQIIVVDNPVRPGSSLVHRLVGRTDTGSLITRGDANPAADSTPVPAGDSCGLGRLKVPYIGLPMLWFRHHEYTKVAATLAIATMLVGSLWTRSPSATDQQPATDRRDANLPTQEA